MGNIGSHVDLTSVWRGHQAERRSGWISPNEVSKLRDMLTGQVLTGTPQGATMVFDTPLVPGSYRVFSAE
jgi:hypothetical protein